MQWLELSAELGIIQKGWVDAAKVRGYTTLRKFGVKKTPEQMKKKSKYTYGAPTAISTGVTDAIFGPLESF